VNDYYGLNAFEYVLKWQTEMFATTNKRRASALLQQFRSTFPEMEPNVVAAIMRGDCIIYPGNNPGSINIDMLGDLDK
jgi:hypothetical protein